LLPAQARGNRVGKTNAKVVVVDAATGQEIASRSTQNRVAKHGLYPHYDIEALWGFVVDTLAIFAQSPGFDAISVTAHGAAAALLGDNDLAMPVIDYEHVYPDNVRTAYAALRPDFAETRSPDCLPHSRKYQNFFLSLDNLLDTCIDITKHAYLRQCAP
jgi:sugar (pentulose or hexulose) kinase